ncbi:P-loop NTPase family protein [Neokomagataea anthophila]|uniref:AAA family ATPase n=1 Tax=Neokomagataea anthophila TaxID=2826925 RepID=A0ABS5E7H9_9PROT|nr:AAA family ATPase [Neokomagataea anthophila]MBR0559448.1 AAA family ATPase [Neokomagataea anthophila]
MIMGPSNSGKSTLAQAIAHKRNGIAIYLDQLAHKPNTPWVRRPQQEFHALHEQAIAQENWIMEGNYSFLVPARLTRATGVILLDASTPLSLFRYIKRTLGLTPRIGALSSTRHAIHWWMLHHIATTTRQNRRRYAHDFEHYTLPKIALTSRHAPTQFYQQEHLTR